MTKIVYNSCFGGFGLTEEQEARLKELKGRDLSWSDINDIDRTDLDLVQVVEESLNKDRFGSELKIIDLPSGTEYRIDEYDGKEKVIAKDKYDWSIA